MSVIPVIDFNLCGLNVDDSNIDKQNLEKTGKNLIDALSTVGFAYITNAGIKRESVHDVMSTTRKFFQSPLAEKQRYKVSEKKLFSYVGAEDENVNLSKRTDYKEALNLSGKFSFRDDARWPEDLSPGISGTTKAFMVDCKKLVNRLFDSLSLGMGLKEDDNLRKYHQYIHQEGNISGLRVLYYAPALDKKKPGEIRLGEHSDYGTFSLLFQDDVGGLQVEHGGEYVDAVPLDGAILMNVADTLNLQSCGLLKSAKHRVIVPMDPTKADRVRRSFGYFVHVDDEAVVNRPLRYKDEEKNKHHEMEDEPPLTGMQHLANLFSKIF